MFREGALDEEDFGGHVWTDANDSSDSAIDGEDLFLFNGCIAADALVAAFLFGLEGGSAITVDVNGSSIGGAKSLRFSEGGCGGAGTTTIRKKITAPKYNSMSLNPLRG